MNIDQKQIQHFSNAIKSAKKIVFITGAGISVASGIRPFRKDPNAIWETDITERGTFRYFRSKPAESWLWYESRFSALENKLPNPAHVAIKDIEAYCATHGIQTTLITQNVDGLHSKAGSVSPIEIHGQAIYSRCSSKEGCSKGSPTGLTLNNQLNFQTFLTTKQADDLPHCDQCGQVFRPHVLWFDERYDEHESYRFEEAYQAMSEADLFIAVGTSFSVGITEMGLIFAEKNEAEFWGCDLEADHSIPADGWLIGPSEQTLPLVVQTLNSKSN